jgi:hypothetical protein
VTPEPAEREREVPDRSPPELVLPELVLPAPFDRFATGPGLSATGGIDQVVTGGSTRGAISTVVARLADGIHPFGRDRGTDLASEQKSGTPPFGGLEVSAIAPRFPPLRGT